jgi:putative DNA primase/helicase
MESGVIRDANDAHRQLGDAEMLALHDKATSRGGTKPRKQRASKAKLVAETPGADKAGRKPTDEAAESQGIAPEFTEEALALAFAEKHHEHLRYVSKWGSWMHFNGTQWQKEETLLAYDFIRADCREAAKAVDDKNPRLKAELNKARTRSAVETLVRSDRRIAATTSQWDRDDWLLNTPAGIIDLKTGEHVGRDPHRYMTKITSVAPDGQCPKWLRFLDQVTDGDKDLQDYLKRVTGYMLTGSVREHAMFFVYGLGGNGKGTFLGHVGRILGAYHVESPAETFAEKKGERHPTELARLDGARFVLSQETEQGQYWAEARIKSLTGGDIITARFMRGDFFEFRPRFKLCIAGNHKPQLRSVDEAIRRRFNIIPFNIDVKAKFGVNKQLDEELEAEHAGILQWMIEGCLEWQRDGLNPPDCVLAATKDYLDSEDSFGEWLSDFCVAGRDGFQTSLADLFEAWKRYADFNQIKAGDSKMLSSQLQNRGFSKDKTKIGVMFRGLRLKSIEEQEVAGVRLRSVG